MRLAIHPPIEWQTIRLKVKNKNNFFHEMRGKKSDKTITLLKFSVFSLIEHFIKLGQL